jgi:hypothetical protein
LLPRLPRLGVRSANDVIVGELGEMLTRED